MGLASAEDRKESDPLKISIFSFGFKHGAPVDTNLLFDVRFLPNPYWQEKLRPRSGRQPAVSAYVVDSEQGREFLALLKPLLLCIAKQSVAAGKKELRIGIGCTGGRHRSVAVVESLGRTLRRESNWQLQVFHRDIDRESS